MDGYAEYEALRLRIELNLPQSGDRHAQAEAICQKLEREAGVAGTFKERATAYISLLQAGFLPDQTDRTPAPVGAASPAPTPFVLTEEIRARIANDKKAAEQRAKEDAAQHIKNVKAAHEFTNGE
jgi:hypothetical protein